MSDDYKEYIDKQKNIKAEKLLNTAFNSLLENRKKESAEAIKKSLKLHKMHHIYLLAAFKGISEIKFTDSNDPSFEKPKIGTKDVHAFSTIPSLYGFFLTERACNKFITVVSGVTDTELKNTYFKATMTLKDFINFVCNVFLPLISAGNIRQEDFNYYFDYYQSNLPNIVIMLLQHKDLKDDYKTQLYNFIEELLQKIYKFSEDQVKEFNVSEKMNARLEIQSLSKHKWLLTEAQANSLEKNILSVYYFANIDYTPEKVKDKVTLIEYTEKVEERRLETTPDDLTRKLFLDADNLPTLIDADAINNIKIEDLLFKRGPIALEYLKGSYGNGNNGRFTINKFEFSILDDIQNIQFDFTSYEKKLDQEYNEEIALIQNIQAKYEVNENIHKELQYYDAAFKAFYTNVTDDDAKIFEDNIPAHITSEERNYLTILYKAFFNEQNPALCNQYLETIFKFSNEIRESMFLASFTMIFALNQLQGDSNKNGDDSKKDYSNAITKIAEQSSYYLEKNNSNQMQKRFQKIYWYAFSAPIIECLSASVSKQIEDFVFEPFNK